jgi:hypothetical protein
MIVHPRVKRQGSREQGVGGMKKEPIKSHEDLEKISWVIGCLGYTVFAAYAHQLQHTHNYTRLLLI